MKIAEYCGADRIELCDALREDGLTPSSELIHQACEKIHLPIHVLIRPRAGDFFYSEEELMAIEHQIEMVLKFPVAGVVVGHLSEDCVPSLSILEKWRSMTRGKELTFHRAFDRVKDPFHVLESLIHAGFDRILTSGLKERASDGLGLLKDLHSVADGRITIMPGGGIHHHNIHLFKHAGFEEVHLSAKPLDWPADQEPVADPLILRKVVTTFHGVNKKP